LVIQFLKLRPVGGRSGDLFPEHLFAPGSLQLGKLAGEVLGLGRDAGIAVNHGQLWNRNLEQKNEILSMPWICSKYLEGYMRLT